MQALAQTRDGFIWLGTEVGLVRFDGNTFTILDQKSKPSLPGNDVRYLLATDDGSLWIGTTDGVAQLHDGRVSIFNTSNGLPGNRIQSLAQKPNGAVIVQTDAGPALISSGRVESLSPDLPYTAASPTKTQLEKILGSQFPGTRIQATCTDREGALWIGTNAGLVRYAPGKLERFPLTDPLATISILATLEDREGNLWVGTETSVLHILRDERFRTLGTRDGLSSDATTTVVEDAAGTLWVGTSGYGLNAITHSGINFANTKTYTVRDGLTSDIILSLAAAPNADLWVGTPDGLNRIRHGAITAFTTADGLPDDFIRSLHVDPDNSLWIGTRRGLAHLTFTSATPHTDIFTQSTGLGSDLVGAMARDTNGNLWVATLAGLSRLTGTAITNFTAANGLSSNIITALLPRPNGTLLVGTQGHGWNTWDGSHFSPVTSVAPIKPMEIPSGTPYLDDTTIHAILDDNPGSPATGGSPMGGRWGGNKSHLWFATGNGIARCDCDMQGGCDHWMEFGPADGLRTREMATNSHPSAWRSHDGLLWFATPKGLVQVDPAHFPVNTVPPPVALVRFAVDDIDQTLNDGYLKVPAGHNHFQFDYAGLSFTAPQKVHYRYMLEGFDHQWTDAGTRRSAFYTSIPPGHYTFRVQAANNDGIWNSTGASFAYQLKPHFYQTIWFYLLLVAFAAALVLIALRLRLLRAQREFNVVLAERNRIAREVHDTLAQGYVGVSVQLEVVSELLRNHKTDAAIRHLDTTRQHVREGLAEARQSIWALRSQDTGENTLPVKLRRVTEHANGHGVEAAFSLYGAYRPMPPGMELEILRIGQEAIHNVKKHAGAKHLSVQLEYGPAEVALIIRDDGVGFETPNGAKSPTGHYGLTGMRERADLIGGTLEVISEVGSGTTVSLHLVTPKETTTQATQERSEP